ncbi:choice-of-anchor B family protein, partial [Rhodocaloribacter sp.]
MKKPSLLPTLFMLMIMPAALPAAAQNFGGAVVVGEDEILVGETNNQSTSSTVYVFGRDGDRWVERARLNASDADGKDDRFGRALALDGDVLVAGATTKDGLKGAAYVFERGADGQWRETAKLSPDDLAEGDHLGRAVAVSGDFIMVSAAGKNESAGAVYVFRREAGGAWRMHSTLTAPEGQPEDLFGLALALDGDKALIAAPFRDENAGAVYAFHYDPAADAWVADGKVEASGIEKEYQFGLTLALDGDDALIGAPRFRGNLGAAFLFSYDAEEGAWRQTSKLIPFDGEEGRLGSALALDGEEVWLGSPGALGFSGAVYRYHRDGETGRWSGVTKIGGKDTQRQDLFGSALAVRGDLAVVGATNDDYGAGTAYVFERRGTQWVETATLAVESAGMASITGGKVSCEDGVAAGFDCDNVDLVSFLSVKDIGGGRGVRTNDLWGWTDPDSGKEYALVGRLDGTAFVDISDPYHPVHLGSLPLHEGARPATWRDIKVYKDHAYIVSDGSGPHGMQVFDLTQLRRVETPPVTFTETAHYDKVNSVHNIVINEDTGFAFAVGASMGGETCGGGLHMIDIRDPEHPTFAGCFAHTGTGR